MWKAALVSGSLLLMACVIAPVHADNNDDAVMAQRCPAFTAWEKAHPELSDKNRAKKIVVGKPSEPKLRQQLLEMAKADQSAREAWVSAGSKVDSGNDPAFKKVMTVDADNLKELKPVIERQGFPTPAQVGMDGGESAFILIQHAVKDPVLQEHVLPQLEVLYKQGLVSGQDLALLTDRTLLAQGKPQRYGTQFMAYDNNPKMKLRPIEDIKHVDARRADIGLPKLADYACILSVVYNKPVEAMP